MGCAGVVVSLHPTALGNSCHDDSLPTLVGVMAIPLFPVGWMQCHHPHWLAPLPTATSLLSQTIGDKDAFYTRVCMGRVGPGLQGGCHLSQHTSTAPVFARFDHKSVC